MKIYGIVLIIILITPHLSVNAQSYEIQQLILNIQKLNQLKSILSQMRKGYQILTTGYNTVKDLSQGNFSLHKTFLDGLLEVSPTVKKYKRVAEIVSIQQKLVRQYKGAFFEFGNSDAFSVDEIEYLEKIYSNLFDRSLKDLEELLMVITAGKLRMNDAERLGAIDRIYHDMRNKLDFLQRFNEKTTLLGAQRNKALHEYETLKKITEKK